jgi:hypothetical protein
MGTKLKPRRLTDASVAKLALAKTAAGYFCRDDILPGFSIRVGLNRRTWRYDHEYRDESGRRHQISVKLGEFKPSEPGHVGADEARAKVPNTPEQRRRTAHGARGTDRLRTKLLLNHQIDRDVTDSYASPGEMSDELREAQDAVSEFIIKNVGSNANARLTARLAISLGSDPIDRSSKLGKNLRVEIYNA